MDICMEIWVYGIWVWFCMELVKFRMEKCRSCTIVCVCLVLGVESINTWFGDSQSHF